MAKPYDTRDIYLETGKKKVFAVSVNWPGWARSGRDESSAIENLWESGSRYTEIIDTGKLHFTSPSSPVEFNVISRLEGSATTDFGAPDAQLPDDDKPISDKEIDRFKAILTACWQAFDSAVASAQGKELQKGPRGGGRDLEKIFSHVVEAEESYLRVLGVKIRSEKNEPVAEKMIRLREGAFNGLDLAAEGKLPSEGPRGGKRWPPRFYIRRVAWHAVDHAWEIEDRIII